MEGQCDIATMKADCQNTMAQELAFFQETLRQKEAAQLTAQDDFRNAYETERQKVKLITSDKETLQRELVTTQANLRSLKSKLKQSLAKWKSGSHHK